MHVVLSVFTHTCVSPTAYQSDTSLNTHLVSMVANKCTLPLCSWDQSQCVMSHGIYLASSPSSFPLSVHSRKELVNTGGFKLLTSGSSDRATQIWLQNKIMWMCDSLKAWRPKITSVKDKTRSYRTQYVSVCWWLTQWRCCWGNTICPVYLLLDTVTQDTNCDKGIRRGKDNKFTGVNCKLTCFVDFILWFGD